VDLEKEKDSNPGVVTKESAHYPQWRKRVGKEKSKHGGAKKDRHPYAHEKRGVGKEQIARLPNNSREEGKKPTKKKSKTQQGGEPNGSLPLTGNAFHQERRKRQPSRLSVGGFDRGRK